MGQDSQLNDGRRKWSHISKLNVSQNKLKQADQEKPVQIRRRWLKIQGWIKTTNWANILQRFAAFVVNGTTIKILYKAPFTNCHFVTNDSFPIQQYTALSSKDLVGVRGLKITVLCIHFTVISYSVECFTFVKFPSLRLLFCSQMRSTTFAYIYFKRRCLWPFDIYWSKTFDRNGNVWVFITNISFLFLSCHCFFQQKLHFPVNKFWMMIIGYVSKEICLKSPWSMRTNQFTVWMDGH